MRIFLALCVYLVGIAGMAPDVSRAQDTSPFGKGRDTLPPRLKPDSVFWDTLELAGRERPSLRLETYLKKNDQVARSRAFYDTLRALMAQKPLTAELNKMLFKRPAKDGKQKFRRSEREFKPYEGQIIRKIYLRKLDLFEEDTVGGERNLVSWFLKAGNVLHIDTRDFIIRQNLIFQQGERIKPYKLSDNERILRQLDFLSHVDIEVIPNIASDSADVFIITRDFWSIGAGFNPHSLQKFSGKLYDLNLLGLGREFSNQLEVNLKNEHPYTYTATYKADNLGGTFIEGKGLYRTSYMEHAKELELTRKPFLQNLRLLGGVQFGEYRIRRKFLRETRYDTLKYKYRLYDGWVGWNFIRGPEKRRSLLLSVAHQYHNFTDRTPYLAQFQRFQDRHLYLASASLAEFRYFTTTNVFGYGRTEDIPYGYLFRLTAGYEDRRGENRHYLGFNSAFSKTLRNGGYVLGTLDAGSYTDQGRLEDGVLQFKGIYLSPLMQLGRGVFRQYVAMESTLGMNRPVLDSIHINGRLGLRDFSSHYTYGKSRASLHLEGVWFTPWYFYNFEFALFGFADMGVISDNYTFSSGRLYSGFGLGFRVGNDQMAINNIEFRLAFYPNAPKDEQFLQTKISGGKRNFESDVLKIKPGLVNYK